MGRIPTTIPRRQLGRRLREMRQEAGMSIQDAARLIERGAGTVQRLEKGEANRIRMLDIQGLCQIYDRMDQFEELIELAKVAATGDGAGGLWLGADGLWQNEYRPAIRADFGLYVSLETAASKLTMYRPDIIDGLFQIPAYARALDALYFPDADSEELDQRTNIRLNRQRIVTRRRNPVDVDLVIDESVLRRIVGDPNIMRRQLRHLADLSVNVTVEILPFSSGYPGGIAPGPFTILDFDRVTGEPPTVFVENFAGNIYHDRPETVARYRDAHEARKRVALSQADSKQTLRRIAREYE
ncbi:helix-turn-helix domain-containing protein [Nocardia carnea]|uniref:helix-turn-helix domain-containing protein n=1 Tax=Nocardia carnea TaxID=37328 RepID=UPI0024571CC4|nr:helix-turn-helix transcriptional regulator [Nocardia carnea]